MKYAIIIPDGAADHPLPQLEGKTPLQAAKKPHMDRLAAEGRQGTVATTPAGMTCGSDICCLSLLGYDPLKYHKGRAPLEAAALGIELAESDWVFRVNLVTVLDGRMQDHSAGHISNEEARKLLGDLAGHMDLPDMALYPGVSYRNILVDRSGRDWRGLVTTPPHDIPGQAIDGELPRGSRHAELLVRLMEESAAVFAGHEINQTRRELGELPATHLWPWGQGQRPAIPSFQEVYGLKGAIITAVDLLAGIATFIGWDRLAVPGQTSYHDTDYAAAGRHAVAALERYDLVCVHVEAPDEAGHAGDAPTKVAAIEAIDEHVVGPVYEALRGGGEPFRVLCLPDHYTAVATRKHDATPVPFVIAGQGIRAIRQAPFDEASAASADLIVARGHELMDYFLHAGLGGCQAPLGGKLMLLPMANGWRGSGWRMSKDERIQAERLAAVARATIRG